LKTGALNDKDLHVIAKYENLEKLSLGYADSVCVPPWHAVGWLAPSLTRLTSLSIDDGSESYDVLRTLMGTERLRSRLEELSISDSSHSLSCSDLRALTALPALHSLSLECSELQSGVGQLAQTHHDSLQELSLSFTAEDDDSTQPCSLAIFPGSLTSLTSLTLLHRGDLGKQDQLIAAVSALTNLQKLSTDFALQGAEAQQQALGQLKQLTRLELHHSIGEGEWPLLHVLEHLPELRELEAPCFTIPGSALQHPALSHMDVCDIDAGEDWRGQVAEGCQVQVLALNREGWKAEVQLQETVFANLPGLPLLRQLSARGMESVSGRYVHLASMLRRHSSSLQQVDLELSGPLEEGLPQELPACTVLRLTGKAVSSVTLQMLAMCRLPVLADVHLSCAGLGRKVVVEADFGWLRQLPALKTVWLHVDDDVVAAGVRELLRGAVQIELVCS
jgi:hypothetical protein